MVTETWVVVMAPPGSFSLASGVAFGGCAAQHRLDARDGACHARRDLAGHLLEARIASERPVELDGEAGAIVAHHGKLGLERLETLLGIEPRGRRELEPLERRREALQGLIEMLRFGDRHGTGEPSA